MIALETGATGFSTKDQHFFAPEDSKLEK